MKKIYGNLVADIPLYILTFRTDKLCIYEELHLMTSFMSDPDYFLRLHKFNKRYLHSKSKEKKDL